MAAARHVPPEMHVIDWAKAQDEDPVIRKTKDWLKSDWTISLKTSLGDEATSPKGKAFISRQKSLILLNGKLYVKSTSKGETDTMKLFIVPKAHHKEAINGCHRDARHQGQNRTVSLLWDWFWWPGMSQGG